MKDTSQSMMGNVKAGVGFKLQQDLHWGAPAPPPKQKTQKLDKLNKKKLQSIVFVMSYLYVNESMT